jgi:hypothetical protein
MPSLARGTIATAIVAAHSGDNHNPNAPATCSCSAPPITVWKIILTLLGRHPLATQALTTSTHLPSHLNHHREVSPSRSYLPPLPACQSCCARHESASIPDSDRPKKVRGRIGLAIGGTQMVAIRNDRYAGRCGEYEHDWREIPLHEDCHICARCDEVWEASAVHAPRSETFCPRSTVYQVPYNAGVGSGGETNSEVCHAEQRAV